MPPHLTPAQKREQERLRKKAEREGTTNLPTYSTDPYQRTQQNPNPPPRPKGSSKGAQSAAAKPPPRDMRSPDTRDAAAAASKPKPSSGKPKPTSYINPVMETGTPGLVQDTVTGFIRPILIGEKPIPRKAKPGKKTQLKQPDWRYDPGGGYVDANNPKDRIPIATTAAGRKAQEKAFKQYRAQREKADFLDQQRMIREAQQRQYLNKRLISFRQGMPGHTDAPDKGWFRSAIGALGSAYHTVDSLGNRVMDTIWDELDDSPREDWEEVKGAGRFVKNAALAYNRAAPGILDAVADWGEKPAHKQWNDTVKMATAFNAAIASLPTTLAANVGAPESANEWVRQQYLSDSGLGEKDRKDAERLSHAIQEAIGGSLAKPGFQAADPLNGLLLVVGTALSPVRAARFVPAAAKGLATGKGMQASFTAGKEAVKGRGYTVRAAKGLHNWARGVRDLTPPNTLSKSPARANIAANVYDRMGREQGEAYMAISDSLALQVKERIEANLPEYKAYLDERIANGTATTADREMRRDLAMWTTHGVPDDVAYQYIHEWKGEIPTWLRDEWQKQYPGYDIRFRLSDLEHPFLPTPAEMATNLKRRVNIAPLEHANPRVLDENGIPMIGPITMEERARRILMATPDIAIRRHDASFYQTLESGFSSILADREIMAWLASQVGASPSRGVLDLVRVMNRIREGGTVGENEIGLAAKAMEAILQGEHSLSKGAAAKISDFIDSAIGSPTRRWVGNDPAGGVPFVSDRWSARAEGLVDEPFLRKLQSRGIDAPKLDVTGDGLTAVQYEQVAKNGEEFSQYLNQIGFDGRHDWIPSEAQALEWAAIQRYWGEAPEDIRKAITVNAHTFSFEATRGMSNLGDDLTLAQTRKVSERVAPDVEDLVRQIAPDAIISKTRLTVDGWAQGENVAIHFDALNVTDEQAQEITTILAQAYDQHLVQATKNATKGAKRSLMFASPAFKSETTKVRFMKAFYKYAPDYSPHGYMTDILHGDPATVIITGKPYMAASKSNETWVKDIEEAITKAEQEVGIEVRYTASNHQIRIGDKHGPASFTAEGGRERALEDLHPAARRARERLDAALADVRAGTEVNPSVNLEEVDRQIAKVERQIDALIRDRAAQLGGHEAGVFMPSGGRPKRPSREWIPGIDRRGRSRGAIGGHAGAYIEPGPQRGYGPRRTGWQNAKIVAEQQLIEEGGHASKLMDELEELRAQRESTYPDWARFRDEPMKGRLHGVEVYMGEAAPRVPIDVGKSGIYIGSTPMSTTTAAHEFWGHYMHRWLTPSQKKHVERLIGDDPEAFPQMIEEYLLAAAEGRKADVPPQLIPALENLGKKALQEFQDYASNPGARARVFMPDEVASFIDSLMSFDGEALTSRFGIRQLQAGDLTAQIPGKSRSRITGALIERPADAVSKWLGRSEKARNVPAVRLATEQERVAKAAGRENVLDAHRAHAQMLHFERAMPRQGTADDVAHYWWAQMPADKRTLEGLGDVRSKLAANLEELQSGRALEELQTALENTRGIEDAFERLQRSQSLKLIIADIPQQMDDLTKAIAALDQTIAKAPELDPRIIEAVHAVSSARRETLEAAGLLDSTTATNREGLVSRWLGYDPTGEEAFIGHRGGETRGATESLMPRSVGTGRVRTPEGVAQENKLILANQGRLNMSTHVAYHDWEASQVYGNTLRFRNDVALMGKAYDGGRLPKDTYLFNPKGKIVPRSWKRDPFANLDDDAAIEQAAKEIRNSFMAGTQEEVDAMIEVAKAEGMNLDDLRVVPKRLVDRYYQQFARTPAKTVGGQAYDVGMNFVMTSIIFARVGYIPKNIVQNLVMAVPHQGAFFLTNAPRAAQLLADPGMRDLLRVEIGSGVTGALIKEATTVKGLRKLPGKVAQGVTHIADDPLRMSAWLHEAAKEGIIPRIGVRLSEADIARIRAVLTDPANRKIANDIAQRTRNSMADFNRMTNKQRMWARRFLIIPGWLVAGTRYPFVFAAHYPLRTTAMAYALSGAPGAEYLGLPDAPNIAEEFVTGGKRFGDFVTAIPIPGTDRALRTNSLSPVNTPWDMGRTALGKSEESPWGYANPLFQAGVNFAQKREHDWSDPTNYGDAAKANLLGLLPSVTFAQDMLGKGAQGGFGSRYPEDETPWGRFKRELGIVPIKIGEKISKSDAGLYAEARKAAPNSDFAPLQDAMVFKTQVAAARRHAGDGPDYHSKAYAGELAVLRDRHMISPETYRSMLAGAKGADIEDIKEWREWLQSNFFEDGYLSTIRDWKHFVAEQAKGEK